MFSWYFGPEKSIQFSVLDPIPTLCMPPLGDYLKDFNSRVTQQTVNLWEALTCCVPSI